MPRLKKSKAEEQDVLFRATVESGKILNGVSNKDLARLMGKSVRTVQNKNLHPETMTLDEIRLYIKALKLNREQVINLVGGAYE